MSKRQPITHELKCHPEPFQAVVDGTKPFEWRKDDRDYRVGDTLLLREWEPGLAAVVIDTENEYGVECVPMGYTGRECSRVVTYIIREGFGIPEGYCIMGLAHQGKELTDEEIERIVNSLFTPGVDHALQRYSWRSALEYARDHGYLRPSPGLTESELKSKAVDAANDAKYLTDESIMFWAFRYTLGRHTYAVSDVAGYLIRHKVKIHPTTRSMIVREIKEHFDKYGDGGWECDKSSWDDVVRAFSDPA